MDPEQIVELRRWAGGLEAAESPELRAAARAILLLAEEIDRLHAELAARGLPAEAREQVAGEPAALAGGQDADRGGLLGSLKTPWSRWRTSADAEL